MSEPGWSLGGGVSFFSGVMSSSVFLSSFPTVSVSPGAVASLERRLGPSSWLVLGVNASYMRDRTDAPPAGLGGPTHQDYASVGASAGIRHQVTGARAPVAVSILALAEGGWVDQDNRYVDSGGDVRRTTGSGWAAGATLGLAIERELTTNLALRLATPLLFASYSETRSEIDAAGVDATGVRAGVRLAPSLELRLYF